MNNRSQAVRLPKVLQFYVSEVFLRKQGEGVIFSLRPQGWIEFLASTEVASPDYMNNVEDLPVQKREF